MGLVLIGEARTGAPAGTISVFPLIALGWDTPVEVTETKVREHSGEVRFSDGISRLRAWGSDWSD